jgi:two-component system, OmpR family, alkaline phosphatase synthesis response regulator PhoP
MDNKGKKILVADDEPDILEVIEYSLTGEGYTVITAKNGDEALEKAKASQPQLIMLDIMMPKKSGIEVCEILRQKPEFQDTLIIFLTALSDENIQVKGLESGADDYLGKPISPKVLVSRVNALFRRAEKNLANGQPDEDFSIDPEKYLVTVKGEEKSLAKKEFELIYLLYSKPGRVFLRNEILEKVWGTDVIVGDRTIDVHIRKIRSKLGVECIRTIKGVGYKFELAGE